MRRIGLAVVLALSLLFASLAGEAQQVGKVYRVGYLAVAPPTASTAPLFDAFVDGLREHCHVGLLVGTLTIIHCRSLARSLA